MEDEKKVTVSQNNNGKGNPYHEPAGSEKGGQFAPANKATSGQKVEAAAANNGGSGFDDFMSFLFESKGIDPNSVGNKDEMPNPEEPDISEEELSEMAKDYGYTDEEKNIDDIAGEIAEISAEDVQAELDKEAAEQTNKNKEFLMYLPFINEESVSKISDEEAAKVSLAYHKLAGEQAYINGAVAPYNKQACIGVWKQPVYPSQYKEKLESGSIEKKYQFYKYDYKGDNKDEWIAKLDKFVKDGEAYEEALAAAKADFSEEHEIVDAFEKEHKMSEEQIMALDAYSEKRKKAAPILDLGDVYTEVAATQKKYQAHFDAWINKCTPSERNVMEAYTGWFSWLNEPLREIPYIQTKTPPAFIAGVNDMTSAISKSVFNTDMTLKRGTRQIRVNNIGGEGFLIDRYTSQEKLNSIIGTTFKDQAFVSASGSEHAYKEGEEYPDVRLNIFVPAGVEVGFFAPFSGFGKENEFVINRGYNYRITNARKVGGQVIMDVEVILGSNKTAHSQEKLYEIADKYAAK